MSIIQKRAAWIIACAGWVTFVQASTVFVREKAGTIWQDGLLVGNGATAAIGYAPAGLEWIINRNDVLDSRVATCDEMPHAEVMACVKTNEGHSVAFLGPIERARTQLPKNIGDKLTLTLSAAILRVRFWPGVGWAMPATPAARQELDTRTGELHTTLTNPLVTREALAFIERTRDVMAVELTPDGTSGLPSWVELSRPEDVRLEELPCHWTNAADVVAFTQQLPGGETYAVALSAPGGAYTAARTARLKVAGRRALFLAVRTTRDAADPCAAAIAAVQAATREGYAAVRAANRAWWTNFWAKGAQAHFASDESVDTQWNYALYALAAQYGATPMPGLNGLFYGPLGGLDGGVNYNCYVHDQNVQIPLMPFFPLGHADFIEPFVKTYEQALPELERRTRALFGADGAYLPLNMNHFGFEHPIADYRYTLCGGAYSGLVLAQAWWYTHDEAVLRRIYPLLKKFILFYTSTMTKDANGAYHFIWSVPPEIFTGTKDETSLIACLKPCLEVAVEAATRFGCDAAERTLWQDMLAHYPQVARHSEGGWWCGPEVPDDHYMYGGHLFYPFFPAESETDVTVARKTLDYTWKYGVDVAWTTPTPHPVHDWSALYTGMATTRAYGGTRGWQALKDFQAGYAKPNGHFSHNPILVTNLTTEAARANMARAPRVVRRNYHNRLNPVSRRGPEDLTQQASGKAVVAPVIEGGASFLLLASEALCQSWGGEIRLFPSVPKNFTGSFTNFRVRGGYVVSAEMTNGRLVDYTITGVGAKDKLTVTCPTDPDFVQLPGEPAWKEPLPPGPFPDVLSAYVFRNWGLVAPKVLAATIGATEAEIVAVAVEMGLSPTPVVSPRWRDMGYVTILRRNWHLLPYNQLMALVGKNRRQMRYALVEDDYLGTKLGMPKPKCARLVYSPAVADAGREARVRLRETLAAEGVKIVEAAEEPRFAFLDAFGKLAQAKSSAKDDSTRFDLRMIYPFSLDYGDPLADDEVASCPEGLVADLAARGINAIWMHVVLSTLTTDPRYPEFGQDAVRRVANLQKLVARCARWGVKVILYINEPRAQPAAFFEVPGREAMRGSIDNHNGLAYCRCTRHPDTLRWLRDSLQQLFTAVPGLGGVFTITMSENATHCGSQYRKPDQVTCPHCKGQSIADLVVDVNRAIFDGVKTGNPAAHVIFNDTAWELVDDPLTTIVPRLPKAGRLVVWSEKFLPFTQGGQTFKVNEYSISHPGPAERALGYWDAATRAGLKADAKLQVNDCWEISAVPYLPVMDLVAEHADNLSRSCVDGVMLSWSLGGYPGPGLELFRRFKKGNNAPQAILDGLAEDLYGKAAVPFVRQAWAAYSAAYRNYPMQWQTVYYSPVQMGPANLLYAAKADWRATMVNTPYDDLSRWTAGYGTNTALWVAQMRRVAEGFDQADALWQVALQHCTGVARVVAERDSVIFRAATLHFRTCVDQADFIQARDRGDLPAMQVAARRELATAKEMLMLVRRESALGYESSNRYIYVPNDLLEKILNCRSILGR